MSTPDAYKTLGADQSSRASSKEAAPNDTYFQERELKKGVAGWVLLTCLGVSYVISGDFAGWNFGLAEGGFGGLLIATLLMAFMYTGMALALAELSAAIPTAGGGYGFARRALGPLAGFLTGWAILLEYAIAPAAIVIFVSGYISELTGFGGPVIYVSFYAVFVAIHMWGVGEALKVMLAIAGVAVAALLVFALAMIPQFDAANLFDIAADARAAGSSPFLPQGWLGIWSAIPFAIWFFLAVEGIPLAAEEAKDPARDMPRAILSSMAILFVLAILVLVLATGGAGALAMSDHPAPLVGSLEAAYGEGAPVAYVVNVLGLAGLIASFFSIIFAYSRQLFALSRAGYLPKWLSLTSRRKTPTMALLVPGALGLGLSFTGEGDLLISMAVFGAAISYVLMIFSHIVLRLREPELERPYRSPGGVATSCAALLLAIAALVSTFLVSPIAAGLTAIVYIAGVAYFALYSRHHLVEDAPEEAFSADLR
ncbi:MAG: ethanolamine permease [Pseudomonadota bacterium]